jgi:hypothetical protein
MLDKLTQTSDNNSCRWPMFRARSFVQVDYFRAISNTARARMQEELGWTRSSLRKCIRPLVENGLRAHDDDPRVPVLNHTRAIEEFA